MPPAEGSPNDGVTNAEAVARLSGFGFEAKKWTATGLVAATFGATATSSIGLYFAALPAIVLFMYLDAYYLAAERTFRAERTEDLERRVSLRGFFDAISSAAVWPFYAMAGLCVLLLTWISV